VNWNRGNLWYLLKLFGDMKYWLFFVFAIIWIRLLFMVLENAFKPASKKHSKFVHPYPNIARSANLNVGMRVGLSEQPKPAGENGSTEQYAASSVKRAQPLRAPNYFKR
jgi:hypothetical protein